MSEDFLPPESDFLEKKLAAKRRQEEFSLEMQRRKDEEKRLEGESVLSFCGVDLFLVQSRDSLYERPVFEINSDNLNLDEWEPSRYALDTWKTHEAAMIKAKEQLLYVVGRLFGRLIELSNAFHGGRIYREQEIKRDSGYDEYKKIARKSERSLFLDERKKFMEFLSTLEARETIERYKGVLEQEMEEANFLKKR